MDNKKLFKILYNDIVGIAELFAEKGNTGFDEIEAEFIDSRLSGAKHIIQRLSEKENIETKAEIETNIETKTENKAEQKTKLEESVQPETVTEVETEIEQTIEKYSEIEEEAVEEIEEEAEIEEKIEIEQEQANKPETEPEPDPEIEIEPETETKIDEANNRLGDSFKTEKSVNDSMGGQEEQKLEYKISNSPIKSIKRSVGINDRYLYIRELFGGSADNFNKAVTDLDNLENIQQAVSYLQQNFKWKKNETSLKFVTLIKRRFPNG